MLYTIVTNGPVNRMALQQSCGIVQRLLGGMPRGNPENPEESGERSPTSVRCFDRTIEGGLGKMSLLRADLLSMLPFVGAGLVHLTAKYHYRQLRE